MKALAALLCAITLSVAADDDPVAVLMRVRDQVMAHADRVPNYTCVETIVRDRYEYRMGPAPRSCDDLLGRRRQAGVGTLTRLATTDRLRLDVAMTDSREIYSWAGAAKFEEGEIDELVSTGAIGTGPFAASLLGIFETQDPGFAFEGDRAIDGRRLLEYSFEVTEAQSRYQVKAGKQRIVTGYTGTLLVDPATAQLVRLTVRTDQLPAATNACEVDSTQDYGTVRLRGEDFLLPTLTRARFILPSGAEDENTITFAACREFRRESTVSFGSSPGAAERTPRESPPLPVRLPLGLPVTVELTSTIQADQAAAGDCIQGRLAAPIREDRLKPILAPEGALEEGRLTRVDTRYGNPNEVTIGLQWERLAVDGVPAPLSLTPDLGSEYRTAVKPGELRQRPIRFELPQLGEGQYATFRFSGEHVVIQPGLRSQWLTGKP